ncbi:substrate-binding domain-containing protein [Bradyrhizobium sp.]|uniref:substrate-binding domain-containing protein n=1 Tax=Bradyrhizobium sp. TaxID=376 RepID=UPI001EB0E328|nr:substrate-binding domain-containing protein [Bradyrhizobium sp.]MBV8918073.1 substrate-binding domain-containing protein [Bradyrhizobium sp.]MBV9983342.1 substrate-binding domain-containing protein [Bradyrhizobium sp.]
MSAGCRTRCERRSRTGNGYRTSSLRGALGGCEDERSRFCHAHFNRESAKYKSIALPPELAVGPEYGLTVSRKAQAGAADFAMYLLSPAGQKQLQAFGFIAVALPASP